MKLWAFVVIYSGAVRLMSSNNDSVVRVFDCNNFSVLSRFYFPWAVNVCILSRRSNIPVLFCVFLLGFLQCDLHGVLFIKFHQVVCNAH